MLKDNLTKDKILISTAYLATVEYFYFINCATEVILEQYEYYEKQSYRNRCRILTANGVMDLSIPVIKTGKMLIRDIRISEHDNWQANHWRAIESAYNSSAFFEFYADDIRPFYERRWEFLWDFNFEIQQKMLELFDIEKKINLTTSFQIENENFIDLRNLIHPKKESQISSRPYYQVFEQKFGFCPGLSSIDLLFNMGPESQLLLGIS
ncbi:MAG: WbqC family protein [Paludibacter sp.]